MPKAISGRRAQRMARAQNPLEHDILNTGILRNKTAKRKSRDDDDDGGDRERFIDARASRTILAHGLQLQEEDDDDGAEEMKEGGDPAGKTLFVQPSTPDPAAAFAYASRAERAGEGDDGYDDIGADADSDAEGWADEDEDGDADQADLEPKDLETYRRFLPQENEDELLTHGWDGKPAGAQEEAERPSGQGINLADLILQKIAEFEARQEGGAGAMEEDQPDLPPKVIEVYTQVGDILSRYRSGKLPKPFKILPSIPRWEEIIQYARPLDWTPHACYAATRLFVAAKPIVVQRFLENVILDKVREDIRENKRLNPHLFDCLRKSLFRPSAFFKGFLFPLVASGSCTLREAHIVAGVLNRVSVPVLHSAAGVKGLCDIAAREASHGAEGGGATNILIRTLLAKKLALPYQVIDALVFHFLRFRSVDPGAVRESSELMTVGVDGSSAAAARTRLPVIWHQCLLEFACRYKNDITEDQREALLDLLLTHGHSAIASEVRRELLAGRGRGVPVVRGVPEEGGGREAVGLDGDDTMLID